MKKVLKEVHAMNPQFPASQIRGTDVRLHLDSRFIKLFNTLCVAAIYT